MRIASLPIAGSLVLWLILMMMVVLRHPTFLLICALPWFVGFRIGGTTFVPYDSTNTFSSRARLSPSAYDKWARNLLLSMQGLTLRRFMVSPDVSFDRKLSLLFWASAALMHVYASALILMIVLPLNFLLGLYVLSPKFAEATKSASASGAGFAIAAGIMVGQLGGWAAGLFWRSIRASPRRSQDLKRLGATRESARYLVGPQARPGSTGAFFAGFVAGYYLVLVAAHSIFRDTVESTWPMISQFDHRIRIALALCPSISCVLGMYVSGVQHRSFRGMGRDIMTPRSSLMKGWVSALFANYFVNVVGIRWAIAQTAGRPWMETIGIPRFNFVFQFVAPTVAFIGGCLLTFVVAGILETRER
jgi:hypothetical protein